MPSIKIITSEQFKENFTEKTRKEGIIPLSVPHSWTQAFSHRDITFGFHFAVIKDSRVFIKSCALTAFSKKKKNCPFVSKVPAKKKKMYLVAKNLYDHVLINCMTGVGCPIPQAVESKTFHSHRYACSHKMKHSLRQCDQLQQNEIFSFTRLVIWAPQEGLVISYWNMVLWESIITEQ